MKWLFPLMMIASILFALVTGGADEIASAVASQGEKAVQLVLVLTGGICFWSGMMNVAKRSNLTGRIASLLSPLLCRLFPKMKKDDPALESISMNITANMMGLGNAATPMGIRAMKQLQQSNPHPKRADSRMILFVVMNTASIQIIPTTLAMLRMAHGAAHPFDIIPAVLCTSLVSLTVGILAVKLFSAGRKG